MTPAMRWLLVVVILAPSPAQAVDQTLTLACAGTVAVTTVTDAKPETISTGVIVNFTAKTVTIGHLAPAKITAVTDVSVTFGVSNNQGWSSDLDGTIDRVTGDVLADARLTSKSGDLLSSHSYALKCRPTQRMF
jgi:hypothetical protein